MIRKVTEKDKPQMVELFCDNIKMQPSYISHGEIQMGIAINSDELSDQYVERWAAYLDAQMNEFTDTIFVFEQEGLIHGFIIGEIDSDRADDFGVICDLVVSDQKRKAGIGSQLLDKLFDVYKEMGIRDVYLESGIHNHDAHHFFENKGFKKTSSIFRLTI